MSQESLFCFDLRVQHDQTIQKGFVKHFSCSWSLWSMADIKCTITSVYPNIRNNSFQLYTSRCDVWRGIYECLVITGSNSVWNHSLSDSSLISRHAYWHRVRTFKNKPFPQLLELLRGVPQHRDTHFLQFLQLENIRPGRVAGTIRLPGLILFSQGQSNSFPWKRDLVDAMLWVVKEINFAIHFT